MDAMSTQTQAPRPMKLVPYLNVIERAVRAQAWREAKDAIQAFGRKLGISFLAFCTGNTLPEALQSFMEAL